MSIILCVSTYFLCVTLKNMKRTNFFPNKVEFHQFRVDTLYIVYYCILYLYIIIYTNYIVLLYGILKC